MISSNLGLYTLLFKTGFFSTHGIFLILLKVRTFISERQTTIPLPQYLSVLILLGNIWEAKRDNLPSQMPALNLKLLGIILAVIAVAPFLRLIFLLGFVINWLVKKDKPEVL